MEVNHWCATILSFTYFYCFFDKIAPHFVDFHPGILLNYCQVTCTRKRDIFPLGEGEDKGNLRVSQKGDKKVQIRDVHRKIIKTLSKASFSDTTGTPWNDFRTSLTEENLTSVYFVILSFGRRWNRGWLAKTENRETYQPRSHWSLEHSHASKAVRSFLYCGVKRYAKVFF